MKIPGVRRALFGVLAVLMLATSFAASLPTQTASANSGETYTWSGNTTITVSGGVLSGPQTLTSTGPNNSGFSAVLNHNTGCNFKVSMMVSTPNNGVVMFPQVVGGPGDGVTNPCRADLIQGFIGPTAIQGTRPGPGDTPETANQRTIAVTLNSPSPSSSSPDDVTFELKNAGGTTIKRLTVQKDDSADQNPEAGARSVRYQGVFQDVNPGNYTVCFSDVVPTCSSVTKVKYKQATVTAGEDLAARGLRVKLELHWSGPAEEQQVGPATLQLKQGGSTVATVVTDTQTYIPTDAEQQAGGLITVDHIFYLRGAFADVEEGKYQICVSGTSVCRDYTKLKGTSEEITIVLRGHDAQNIILGGTDDEEKPVCQASSSAMSWFLCPIYNGLADFTDWMLLNLIVPFMRPSPVGLNPDDKATGAIYKIWSTMRVYANIILVILLLVAVISQAYGGGIVEAYTARKMLPRILVAAVLINVSIYIVAFSIDIANVVGAGIGDLITAPLVQTGEFEFNPTNTQAFAITGIAAFLGAVTVFLVTSGLLLSILPLLLVFVVLPAFLGLLTVFVTLIILQGLYMALTIFSPVAFALYALPNTEKYFHLWWDWLFRSLLVYPIFMTILALCDVFTVLIQKANS